MCLVVPKSQRTKVAKEDIVVYKTLFKEKNGIYLSTIKGFPYQRGYLYYQTGKKFTTEQSLFDKFIYKGLHSFQFKKEAKKYLHRTKIIVEMIIPKGARYYYDGGKYCSDQLLFPEL